jgi:hypothetical protein
MKDISAQGEKEFAQTISFFSKNMGYKWLSYKFT